MIHFGRGRIVKELADWMAHPNEFGKNQKR